MKKLDLVKAARKGAPNPENIVNSILRSINKTLIEQGRVCIYNFGKFYVERSKVKKVYDWKQGKQINYIGKLRIKFKAAPAIEKLLNEKDKSLPVA